MAYPVEKLEMKTIEIKENMVVRRNLIFSVNKIINLKFQSYIIISYDSNSHEI